MELSGSCQPEVPELQMNPEENSKSRNPSRIQSYSENSTESRLVIDDSSIQSGTWIPQSISVRRESGPPRSESIDSPDQFCPDGDSDNECYEQQVKILTLLSYCLFCPSVRPSVHNICLRSDTFSLGWLEIQKNECYD